VSHPSADQQPGQIASSRSARVAASRKLLRRAVRRSEREFLADGPQAVREALTYHRLDGHPNGLRVQVAEVYVEAQLASRHADLLALADEARIRIVTCDAKAIASLSEAVTPQGIVARCAFLDRPLATILARTTVDDGRRPVETSQDENAPYPARPRLVAAPVDVRDPGNLGTIIRCADAAGADGVAILGDSVDLYNAKTVRSTAGSIFHVPVAVEPDPVAGITALRAAGLQIIATEGEASTDLDQFIDAGGLTAPTAWLLGNEAHGLPEEIAALADVRLSISIRGLAESLNLSTAAAICLFASARAQR
jgi:RNA methyltransferase, TrmH family